jgi:hypothetical protein
MVAYEIGIRATMKVSMTAATPIETKQAIQAEALRQANTLRKQIAAGIIPSVKGVAKAQAQAEALENFALFLSELALNEEQPA